MQPGIVVFDLTEFTTAYPEFTGVGSGIAGANFSLSTLNLVNCCGSPVPDPNVRQQLLYLLTAHLTYLFTPGAWNSNSPPGLVGRVSSATEGSVSVAADFPTTAESAWFLQTKYGAQFWQITAVIRTMHYIPAPQNCCGGPPLGFGVGIVDGGNWNGY